jgi:hypothetical protein
VCRDELGWGGEIVGWFSVGQALGFGQHWQELNSGGEGWKRVWPEGAHPASKETTNWRGKI